ncbi:uncharacterized protein LOC123672752 isoform X2 [Harmonia axyridis]|uniref:uncharacterized protein LOC123672752 isoform X2 n=1 Tax=Harmonia axyridis TaxID=115357 RepID=UPI001E275B2E|nr:uncharacterized protein LOC123672752 isoform X2 [Harmonia axyridis]
MDEEILIKLVRNYPNLYLLSDKNFHNLEMKENSWEEISNELDIPAEDCKKKWKNLKDCYRKARAKRQTKNGDPSESITRKWRYEDEMSFLLPNAKEKQQKPNIDISTDEIKIEQHEIEDNEENGDVDCSQDEMDEREISSPTLKIQAQSGSSNTSNTFKRKRQPKPEWSQAFSENEEKRRRVDHLRKFFESAEETTRCLPVEYQVEVKHRISLLLYEFEVKALDYGESSSHHASNE